MDLDANIVDVNHACLEKLGSQKEKLIKIPFKSLFSKEASMEMDFTTLLNDAFDQDQVWEFEMIKETGEGIEMMFSFIPIGLDEKTEGFIAMGKDISDRKRLEREQVRSERELKNLVKNQVGILFKFIKKNEDYVLTLADGKMLSQFNLDSNEIIGNRLKDFPFRAEEIQKHKDSFNEAWHGNVMMYENSYLDSEVLISLMPVKDEKGNIMEVVGSIVDISKQKQLERELVSAKRDAERANKAKTEFLSKVSHDLRTPLNGILGFAQILKIDENLTDEQNEYIEEMMNAGRHLLQLIDTILDLNTIEAGNLKLSLQSIDVSFIIKEVIKLFKPIATSKNIEINERIKGGLLIIGDSTWLRQLFINLLDNAIKFTPMDGKVFVDVYYIEEHVNVVIRDTGVGIPSSDLERIFEPFFRSENSKNDIPGLGLGLTIVNQIVDALKGSITINGIENSGTIVIVTLPLNIERQEKGL